MTLKLVYSEFMYCKDFFFLINCNLSSALFDGKPNKLKFRYKLKSFTKTKNKFVH